LQNEEFCFNDEDVRFKFSVVYTNFRISNSELYGNIDRSTSKSDYHCIFNKFDENEDSYYLKYIFSPRKDGYCYVEKSPLCQYYKSAIDEHIELDFTKKREYNEEVMNN
jgi:hypothetical protein